MNLFTLFRDVNTKEQAVEYLQDKNVLHRRRICRNGHEMVLQLTAKNDRWRCRRGNCRVDVNLKVGTWFEGSNMPLEKIAWFIYCWCQQYTSTKFCISELIMSGTTCTDWKNNLREVCAKSLLQSPTQIGGEGLTVEIHESCFSHRKYKVGRAYPHHWVFGGVCRETNEGFLYAVPEPTAETLLEAVSKSVRPGSTIVSDLFKSCGGSDLLPQHYSLSTINKSQMIFTNPNTGNEVEAMFSLAKKPKRGLDSYLCEYLWRKRHENAVLVDQIYKDIASVYPLNDVMQ